MNIVLLDDVENHNKQFKALLLDAIQKRHIPAVIALETTRFDDVLDYAASNPPLTVYFLDICLNQEQDGLDVCRRLRRDIVRDQFIFVSAYPHYAMDCLKLHAYDFLLKPVEALAVEECLASLYREIAVEDQTVYELNIGSRTIRIPVNQIYYLTAEGKKLTFFTALGTFSCTKSLAVAEKELATQQFLRVHRKYLVNSVYVDEWNTADDEIVVHGVRLPFARRRQKKLAAGKD